MSTEKVKIFSQWNNEGAERMGFFTLLMVTSDGWREFRADKFDGVWEDQGLLNEEDIPTQEELQDEWQQWGVVEFKR